MKPYPWKCTKCRERTVSPAVAPRYETTLDHDGRTYAVAVDNLDILRCEKCGEVSHADGSSARLVDALRHAVGLLMPSEIRSHRERLGLTQKELAGFLSIAESTLSRWETGGQIQQRSLDKLLRVFFELPDVRRMLGASAPSWTSEAPATAPQSVGAVGNVSQHAGAIIYSMTDFLPTTPPIEPPTPSRKVVGQ